jgi:hypothetical protein
MTTTLIGLCRASGTRIPVTSEALDATGHGVVLCPDCLTVFHVEPVRHKRHVLELRIPRHEPGAVPADHPHHQPFAA